MNKFAKFQLLLFIVLVSVGMFYGGYYMGKSGYIFELRKNPPKVEIINQYPDDTSVDFGLFWEVWDMVNETYLERPLDPQTLVYGAIKGMVASLDDPYTSFFVPELNQEFNENLNNQYQGIGAELALKDDQLIVVAPIEGSPAKDAGIRPGDKILEIEGESSFGLSLREAVAKIRGDAGTLIKLTIQRDTSAPFVVTIKRGVISIDSVTWEDKGNGNIYIRVSRFGENTAADWRKVVSEVNATAPELDTVIVDLRSNPGGLILSALYIAEEFYTDEPVYIIEDSLGNQDPSIASRIGAFEDIPQVYVLIDEGSASAAEILAAALRVHADAILVGKKSFGKGTIQQGFDFEDGSGVHITYAKWLTPDQQWVHNTGIQPDYEVEFTQEDLNNSIDPQLDKVLELADQI